jgi:Uma2 family endonuclease
MDAALKAEFLTAQEYLALEEQSEIRHEFVDGQLFAMAGGSREDNIICGNIFAWLHARLRKGPCRPFIADMKAYLATDTHERFYYPDVMVVCGPRETDKYFTRSPKIVFEVLSESTERTDRSEKLLTYTGADSLEMYILVAQTKVAVTVFRRSEGWRPALLNAVEQELQLDPLALSLPLSVIYEGVEFGQ